MSVDIRLKRVDKTYREGETLSGIVIVHSKGDMSHLGVLLTMDGSVNLQLSAKSVGMFEAFYNSIKPLQLLQYGLEVAKPGKFPSGKTELPFEVPLKPKGNRTLYESYHGVYVNILYQLKVDVKRSVLSKHLTCQSEFVINNIPKEVNEKFKSIPFTISPDSLANIKGRAAVPSFKVHGVIDSTTCRISQPFTGHIVVDHSDTAIKSVELQLVRVETCGCAEGYSKDASEIQNIQIADGDVYRGLSIPIYMVFPRLFTCPSLVATNFKVEFELNIVILLEDNRIITENFPIQIIR